MRNKKSRIGRLVLSLIAISLIISSSVITYSSITNARKGMQDQLNDNATDVINVLSKELDLLVKIEKDYDKLFEKYLLSAATTLGINKGHSDYDLIKVARITGISEINIVNSDGVIAYSNLSDNIGYKYKDDSDVAKLLLKDGISAVESIRQSTVDGNYYKYGAIGTTEGAVQVGMLANELIEMKNNMDISIITGELVDDENIIYIASLDNEFNNVFNSRGEDIVIDISSRAKETVIKDGTYSAIEKDDILGKDIFNYLILRKDSEGNGIGYYYIGLGIDQMKSNMLNMIIRIVIFSILSLVLFLVISIFFINKNLTKPIKNLNTLIAKISRLDLTKDDSYDNSIKNKTEIGEMAENINQMRENLNGIMKITRLSSDSLLEVSDNIARNTNEAAFFH